MFVLFEYNGQVDKVIESWIIVVDVLVKFEKLVVMLEVGDVLWKFYFKFYCFLDIDSMLKDSVEFVFMFEQVYEVVIYGYYLVFEESF